MLLWERSSQFSRGQLIIVENRVYYAQMPFHGKFSRYPAISAVHVTVRVP